MKSKKILGLLLSMAMVTGMLAGCGGGDDQKPAQGSDQGSNQGSNNEGNTGGSDNQNNEDPNGSGNETDGEEVDATPFYLTLDPQVSGSLDVMCWSGDSTYHSDLGHMDLAPEDITSQNVAMVYAMAKEFNNLYPNVKINLYAKADDPNGNDTSWDQELENFKAEHGKYPDVYASNSLADDTAKGMVADLSVYASDPLYQSFNKSVLSTMNYYGFQAGLPQFIQPWGIYVNKELAEDHNIEVPDANWDIDDYTDFIASADNTNFWGLIFSVPTCIIDTGTNTIRAQMQSYDGSGDRLNLASEEVVSLLDYIPKWGENEIFTLNGQGAVDAAVMDDGWWWGYRFFCRNYVLTYAGDPWMMAAAALGQNEDGTWPVNAVESNDWDIYPRPATDYKGNTVGICVDPMAVHNFAMDDGDPAWSDEEKAKMDLAYAFASFWCGSTEAMQARADQLYSDNNTIKSCLNDSFPLVTGEAFEEQMNIWYSVDIHKRYGDAELMPGFQYVVQLWEEGQFWDISDKTYPYYVTEDGTRKECMYEWLNVTDANIMGISVTDASWLDTVKANLADWNTTINARFEEAEESLRNGLINYYGFTDADFQ